MPPVASSQHSVYCACPGAIRPRSLVRRGVDVRRGARAADRRLAEVADVEDADRLAHGGVLLDHAGGVLQRHRPAAELGELGPSATCRSCSGERQEVAAGDGPAEPTAAPSRRPPAGYPAPVTSYTLRSASPAKTRTDAVVVGRRARTDKGARLAPGGRGRRQGLRPQAARRCSPTLGRHRQGRRGRQGARPPGSDHLAAAGARRPRREAVDARRRAPRRRRGRPRRHQRRRRSPLALPADDPRAGARRDRGLRCSAATRSRRTSATTPKQDAAAPARSSCSTPRRRKKDAVAGVRGGPASSPTPSPRPATGSTPRPAT